MKYKAVIIGTSAGGIEALKVVLNHLQLPLRVPIIIVQHLSPNHDSYLASIITQYTGFPAKELDEKEYISPGHIYIAPPNYHVLIEKNLTFSLTVEERVSYARPSIDVTFETAADAYKHQLIGVILTGANHDGANGLHTVMEYGGFTIVQEPKTAYAKEMPQFALDKTQPNFIGSLDEIGIKINQLIQMEI